MTDPVSELIELRVRELEELRSEREAAEHSAAEDQNTLALLDELERIEREIEVEKQAKIRAAAVRQTLANRLASKIGQANLDASQAPAAEPPAEQASEAEPGPATEAGPVVETENTVTEGSAE